MIKTQNTNIREIECKKDDFGFVYELRSDPEVYLNLHDPMSYSLTKVEEWVAGIIKSPTSKRLIAVDSKTGISAGLIRIDNISLLNNNCYLGLDIHKMFRGKGLSKEIYHEVIKWLFNVMNMETIYLEVLNTNKRAIAIYESLGFKKCGSFKNKIVRNNKKISSNIMYINRKLYGEKNETN